MTSEELLRLENIFIKLKNDEKSLEDIYSELKQVPSKLIDEWNRAYTDTLARLKKTNPLGVTSIIEKKDSEGKYVVLNSINFNLRELDKIKFNLWRASNQDLSNFKHASPEKLEVYKRLIEESRIYYDIFSKYFKEIKFDEGEQKGTAYFTLNTDDPLIKSQANDAIYFYINNFYAEEKREIESLLIHSSQVETYQNAQNILPYCIKRFIIKNYQEIIYAEINDIPIDTKWIFITGENGFGKTSVLQAIFIGLFGNKDKDVVINDNHETKIAVEYKKENSNVINNLWSFNFNSLNNVIGYGPSRLQIQAIESQNVAEQKNTNSYSLFNPNGVLHNIEYYLIIWELEKNIKFEKVKNIFLDLIPYLYDIRIETIDGKREVVYLETSSFEMSSNSNYITFNKLASGFKSIIAMVGDMIIRLYQSQSHIIDPSELSGIVIIDELDLHWHPKMQRRLPSLFSQVFPNVQFVVTTHSVIPFLGAPQESIFLKVIRSKEEGIQVERIDIDVSNLLPNILFTSSLFDMESITSINNKDISKVRTEDTAGQMNRNDEINIRLKAFEEGNENFPDDLFKS